LSSDDTKPIADKIIIDVSQSQGNILYILFDHDGEPLLANVYHPKLEESNSLFCATTAIYTPGLRYFDDQNILIEAKPIIDADVPIPWRLYHLYREKKILFVDVYFSEKKASSLNDQVFLLDKFTSEVKIGEPESGLEELLGLKFDPIVVAEYEQEIFQLFTELFPQISLFIKDNYSLDSVEDIFAQIKDMAVEYELGELLVPAITADINPDSDLSLVPLKDFIEENFNLYSSAFTKLGCLRLITDNRVLNSDLYSPDRYTRQEDILLNERSRLYLERDIETLFDKETLTTLDDSIFIEHLIEIFEPIEKEGANS
jgi:hypothetical protein